MIGKTISHYRILEKLGEGGMGVVYKARDTKLDRIVALKFLPKHLLCDEEAKTRFVHEAKAASALDHQNIATIYEIDEAEGECFISMVYIEGKSIKEVIKEKKLSIEAILRIAIQIGEGLNAAHKKDIIHRDIKSDNIMLTHEGLVKIMDFGLAKLKGVTKLTKTGSTLGTLQYMSPEQAQGTEVDQRSDIFSFGVVLYEMVTGQLPFKGEHEAAVVYSIVNETPEPLARYKANVPEGLQRIVDKAMDKSPEMRYQHADDLGADLRKLKKELESGALREQAAPTKAQPSIAVLPFTNLSADKEQEYFCDGMAEEIINALTHVEDLRVVARTSAFAFKGEKIDIREIGKKLNVKTVLEGSVRKAGNRLRISAQLINVADGYHLWSEKYDRNMEDVFAIQDEISLTIVDRLKVKLLVGEKAKLIKRYTGDPEAYNFYLKGRYFYNKRTEEDMKRSIEYFERALEKDPKFALPYAGLAETYATFGFYHWWPYEEARSKAKEFAVKGLEVDDSVGETHGAYANYVLWYEWQWAEAEKEYKKAIQLSPSDVEARHMYAHLLESSGRFDEAIAEMGKALELEPLSINLNHCMAQIHFFAGNYDEAIDLLQKTIEMDPGFPLQYFWLGRVYLQKGELQKALEMFERGADFPTIGTMVLGGLGLAYAVAGRRDEAQGMLEQINNLSKERYVDPYYIAYIYMGLGNTEKVFDLFEQGFEEGDMNLFYLPIDPIFDELHEDPRFKALMKKMGLEK
jgi:serine/threonine protein kinase/Tfp pilus assembly protein PilF